MTSDGADGGRDGRGLLVERLHEAGRDDDEIRRAEREGRLPILAVEATLGGGGRHSLTAAARASRLDPQYLRELLRAAGRPLPGRGQRTLTDDDVELAKLVRELVDQGLPKAEILEVGRVLSQGMAQTTDAVRQLVGDALIRPGDTEEELGLRYAEAVERLGPVVPRLLTAAFRMHLRDGLRRDIITSEEREAGRLRGTRDVAVGFADLVGYTRLGEDLPPEDVGRIAGRFAKLAVGALRPPVQLVKMIGDAAMLVSPEVAPLVDVAVDLRTAVEEAGEDLPQLRIGLAYGPATARGGDWFGSTVNLASRLTGVARPGTIMATPEVCERAPGVAFKPLRRRRRLKGVEGRVRLLRLD